MLTNRPQTVEERKSIFIETLLNTTDKVSKVAPNSVLDGVSSGVAKISQKAEKDIVLALSRLFPDTAYGDQLDQVALDFGAAPRFSDSNSTTYVRLVATPGTTYLANTHFLHSSKGIEFEFEDSSITIGSSGYEYVKVRSLTSGLQTNIPSLTITQIVPAPVGHTYVINEVQALGGRDVESDELFRRRIKDGSNILARGTIAMLEQKFMLINPKVLKCFYQGINSLGKVQIAIVTQNGQDLTGGELSALLSGSQDLFSLTEYKPIGSQFYGVELVSAIFEPIDISFRLDYDPAFSIDDIRQKILVQISKYLDFRFFEPWSQKVEWDNLLEIVKHIPGVKYVPDQYFYPRVDMLIDTHKLPRVRGFRILDLDGNVIQNFSGTLLPIYYPAKADFSFQQTILNI